MAWLSFSSSISWLSSYFSSLLEILGQIAQTERLQMSTEELRALKCFEIDHWCLLRSLLLAVSRSLLPQIHRSVVKFCKTLSSR